MVENQGISSYPIYLARIDAGAPFYWPEREENSYHLHYRCSDFGSGDSLTEDQLLLVTPTGIAIQDLQIGPDDNLKLAWIRVTDHVVLLDPRLTNEEPTEVEVLLDLGILPGWLAVADNPPEFESREVEDWEKRYLYAFDRLANDSASPDEIRLEAFEGWARQADWKLDLTNELASQAVADFQNTPVANKLEKIFTDAAKRAGVNWEYASPLELSSQNKLLIGPLSDGWLQPRSLQEVFAHIKAVFPTRVFNEKEKNRFKWPQTVADSFYLVDASQELYLLCRPASLQIFHAESPVMPGDGFHFLRVSEHVVLQLPAAIDNESAYAQLIEGLGLTIAKVPYKEDNQSKSDSVVIAKFIDWARSVQEVWRARFEKGSPRITPDSDSRSCNSVLFTWWLSYADWNSPDTTEVIRALAGDLAAAPEWVEVERRLRRHCPDNTLDFNELELLGELKKVKPATIAVGEAYSVERASELLKNIEVRYKAVDDKPAWTIDGAHYGT